MANTISIISAKGGVGKTTIALNLSVALAERSRKTLLVDLDPQGAIGLSLARNDTEWAGLAEVMLGKSNLQDAIVKTRLENLSILPRGRLHPADICEYESELFSGQVLNSVIGSLGSSYAYILIDTPSGLGMVTRAGLSVSDFVLLPMQAEPLAMRSVSQVLRVIDKVQSHDKPGLKLLGIIPTMVNLKDDHSFKVMRTLWSGFGGVLDTFIPRADVFLRASEEGLPLNFLGGKTPPDAQRFDMLVSEIETIISRIGRVSGKSEEKQRRELI